MERKRIFIAIHYMEIGGGEMSLIGLLHAIDYSRYDVDLFIYSHQGELMKFIPKEVNVLPEISAYTNIEIPIKDVIKRGFWGIAYARLKTKWQYKRYLKGTGLEKSDEVYRILADNVTPHLPSLKRYGTYDLAMNYLGMHNVVLDKVDAKKKIAWIHTDYSTVHLNVIEEIKLWGAFDNIVSISPGVTKAFLNTFPSLKDKIVEIENILSSEFVRQRAELIPLTEIEKEMPREDGVVRLLSIGRFCEAKNYDNVPDICRRVNSSLFPLSFSFPVRWYIIGWGSDEALIRQKIAEAGMDDSVILLGKKENPYPYIKACDIYCQPSRYEGKSITVREAQMLCKPVVVTNYLTASSQIKEGVDGCIVPLDNVGCAKELCDFIQNKVLQTKISSYLAQHDYGSEAEVDKLYKLIK